MLLKLIINLSNYMKHIGFKELIFICTQELSEPNCVISIYGIYIFFLLRLMNICFSHKNYKHRHIILINVNRYFSTFI